MYKANDKLKKFQISNSKSGERGSAIVISLFVLALVSVFVALALTRSSSEAAAVKNETAEARTTYAAQGSLEMMTRNFNKVYEVKLNPLAADITAVQNAVVPGLSTTAIPAGQYTFLQEVLLTSNPNDPAVVLNGGDFAGLYAKRDNWRLRTTASDSFGGPDAVQVQLTRNILNNRIPIFQFGIFYDDDLEFHPGPRFDFGGRVHSNGNMFLMASNGLYFSSKVTTAKNIFTDTGKNGTYSWSDQVFVNNALGAPIRLRVDKGSVLKNTVNGAPVTTNPLPTAYTSATWPTDRTVFDGNLVADAPVLNLPLRVNSQNADLVELIKRGESVGDLQNDRTGTPAAPNIVPVTAANADDSITQSERYYNKTGIRVSLADSKAKLPGCVTALNVAVAGRCGIRLDGDSLGVTEGVVVGARGYSPKAMVDGYKATEINGERFWLNIANRELWIKVETVIFNTTTQVYDTVDITEEILSLGVTEAAPRFVGGAIPAAEQFQITQAGYTGANGADKRSIIKLQRFMFGGSAVPRVVTASPNSYLSNATLNGIVQNFVRPADVPNGQNCKTAALPPRINGGTYNLANVVFNGDIQNHWVNAEIGAPGGPVECVAPFPINMFDTREGLYNDTAAVFNPLAVGNYESGPGPGINTSKVPWAGVISMVDIDVSNLKAFLDGNFDANMPAIAGSPFFVANARALRSTDIPQPNNVVPKSGGWVFYVSDRRGDRDFDGEYDMEDVYGANDGMTQPGEDLQLLPSQFGFGVLDGDYDGTYVTNGEAVKYNSSNADKPTTDIAAVFEHKYYRRGVRLINGVTTVGGVRTNQVPGMYDTVNPVNTKGFTVASENAVYVLGDYNATGVAAYGTPTVSTDYIPLSTSAGDIPASIAADAIIVLSNNWRDSVSFSTPFTSSTRVAGETFCRFAMLSGDTITSLNAAPNQGGGDLKMNGGVHNFKRFLENWGGVRLNYSGSLINLFNSHNNNGTYKTGPGVYSPPTRNWVFDATFLDINRLPPGTPYFQYIQTTGFQRTNN